MPRPVRENRIAIQLSEDGMGMLMMMKTIFRREGSIIIERAIFELFQSKREEMLKITNEVSERIEDNIFKNRTGNW